MGVQRFVGDVPLEYPVVWSGGHEVLVEVKLKKVRTERRKKDQDQAHSMKVQ